MIASHAQMFWATSLVEVARCAQRLEVFDYGESSLTHWCFVVRVQLRCGARNSTVFAQKSVSLEDRHSDAFWNVAIVFWTAAKRIRQAINSSRLDAAVNDPSTLFRGHLDSESIYNRAKHRMNCMDQTKQVLIDFCSDRF